MTKLTSVVCVGLTIGLFIGVSETQSAEKYPSRPINFIIGVEAGGGADIQERPLVAKLSTILGQPVVVVNKPGAGSSISYRALHDAKPDGYTVGVGMGTLVTNKLQGLLPFDFRDYTLFCAHATGVPIVVASTKRQRNFTSIKEVVEFAKANPGAVSIASGAKGQMWWIGAIEFQKLAGVKFNIIPQEGAGGFSIAQVAGGHTDLAVLGLAEAKTQIDAGNVRLLATFGHRNPFSYPNAPTMKEVGYDVKTCSLITKIGPPNMPKDIVDFLVKAMETGKGPGVCEVPRGEKQYADTLPEPGRGL
jgi:tripartite-type tricarboxylate transporter receptor subunit TctC